MNPESDKPDGPGITFTFLAKELSGYEIGDLILVGTQWREIRAIAHQRSGLVTVRVTSDTEVAPSLTLNFQPSDTVKLRSAE